MANHLSKRAFIISLSIINDAGTGQCLQWIIIQNPTLMKLFAFITFTKLFTLIAFTQLFVFADENLRFSQINWLRLDL